MNTTSPSAGRTPRPNHPDPKGAETDPVLQAIEDEDRRSRALNQQQTAKHLTSLKRWGLAAMCMPFLLAGSLWRDHLRNQQVVSSVPAGELQDLRPVARPTGFKPVVLVLKTSAGFLSLHDPLNLPPGAALVREERQSGRHYVCDVPRTQCAEIAQADKP